MCGVAGRSLRGSDRDGGDLLSKEAQCRRVPGHRWARCWLPCFTPPDPGAPPVPQAQARSLSQSISALGSAVKADVEQVSAGGPMPAALCWSLAASSTAADLLLLLPGRLRHCSTPFLPSACATQVSQHALFKYHIVPPCRCQRCARRCCTWCAPPRPRCTPSSARTRGVRQPRCALRWGGPANSEAWLGRTSARWAGSTTQAGTAAGKVQGTYCSLITPLLPLCCLPAGLGPAGIAGPGGPSGAARHLFARGGGRVPGPPACAPGAGAGQAGLRLAAENGCCRERLPASRLCCSQSQACLVLAYQHPPGLVRGVSYAGSGCGAGGCADGRRRSGWVGSSAVERHGRALLPCGDQVQRAGRHLVLQHCGRH